MDDYIRKDEAINLLEHNDKVFHYADRDKENIVNDTINTLCRVLIEMKSEDVQPVKHGKWIPQGNDMWLCSNCKENIIYSTTKSDRTEKQRYCCRCGAKMDAIYQDDNITAIKVTGWDGDTVPHERCSNYMDCDGTCFIDDSPCDCNGNIEKCKGR